MIIWVVWFILAGRLFLNKQQVFNLMKNIRQFVSQIILEYFEEQKSNINDNFWKWFNGSKITKNGVPLICYHGTSQKNIETFDIGKIGSNTENYGHYGYGIYFSTELKEAKTYGNIIYECFINIKKPFTGTDSQILQLKNKGVGNIDDLIISSIDFQSLKNSFNKKSYIYDFIDTVEKTSKSNAWDKVYNNNSDEWDLNLLNDISDILEYTTLNKEVNGVPDFIIDELNNLNIKPKLNKSFPHKQALHWITNLGQDSEEVTEVIKSLGYDGVWYGTEVIPFSSNQIKSVQNNGDWNVGDVNIFK